MDGWMNERSDGREEIEELKLTYPDGGRGEM
jgi:hypothetical protein